MHFREIVKRNMPFVRNTVIALRRHLAAPPLEDIFLHDYRAVADENAKARVTLVIPSISPENVFGGVSTAIDISLQLAKRSGADFRVILDNFEPATDISALSGRAVQMGIDPSLIQLVRRMEQSPEIPVRVNDLFIAYNSWISINVSALVDHQKAIYGGLSRPYIYLVQDYEPQFYPFSSTHMMSRSAFDPKTPCWAIVNSGELLKYIENQGHRFGKCFVVNPSMSPKLRSFLAADRPPKAKKILVYGRPTIPRNCFPAIEKGLKLWALRHPEFREWEIVSAGWQHKAVPLGNGQMMNSVGKLSIDDYGRLLLTTAVGLSLMASPHPSYPPLEMAHFGIRTVTNSYANKDLSLSHDNIISVDDISADSIAQALALACGDFERSPMAGWSAKSHIPFYFAADPYEFLTAIVSDLEAAGWGGLRGLE